MGLRSREGGLAIRAKKFLAVVVVTLIVLSGIIGYLGYVANQQIEKTVTDQFNRQQLILAREIAHDIRNHMAFLETMLLKTNELWERDAEGGDQTRADVASFFSALRRWQVLAIAHVDRTGTLSAVFGEPGVSNAEALGVGQQDFWRWCIEPGHVGRTFLGRTLRPESGVFKGRWLMAMATPTWRPRVRQAPDSDRTFEGLTFVILDPIAIAQQYTRDIRSGESGYAWVVDDKGTVLAHYEASFVGEDTFTVRQKRDPRMSYEKINEIVRNHLLKGEEGTDWYISGWHRGFTGKMKKVLAYSPVFLSEYDQGNSWSVGVAAPITEVYGITKSAVMRQWLIAGLFQVVVFSCLALAIHFSLRWSRILKEEVDRKTADLSTSEAALRRERDKLKQSMDQLIEMQERLIQSERFAAIGEAAAYLSHEIKNPLVVIGGFAAQVERTFTEDDGRRQKMRLIQDEARRLETLLTEVRDFTRPAKPQKEQEAINAIIEDTLALLENALKEKGILCERHLDEGLPQLLLDPQQIKQLLINLVKNSIEAMPNGGQLVVSSWHEGPNLKVSIVDSGAGMSREMVQKIFNPFFTTKKKGTGLGLAVSRKIIEDHGGEISVESKVGKGTKVTVIFPVASGGERGGQNDRTA